MARITKDSSLTEDQKVELLVGVYTKEGFVRGYKNTQVWKFVQAMLQWWFGKPFNYKEVKLQAAPYLQKLRYGKS